MIWKVLKMVGLMAVVFALCAFVLVTVGSIDLWFGVLVALVFHLDSPAPGIGLFWVGFICVSMIAERVSLSRWGK